LKDFEGWHARSIGELRKVKTRVAARVQLQGGGRNLKAIKIEVMMVD
jgi:hypothetical protein